MAFYHYARALQAFAELSPDRPLLATSHRTITAAELHAAAAGLAGYLHERGVSSGRPVATMLHNRPAILESFYAALLLGSPPANINSRYTAEEIAEVLQDCDAAALVHEAELRDEVRKAAALLDRPLVLLEAESDEYARALASPPAPSRELSPQDRMLWYTGGTTGRPRGVIWEIDTHYRMLWEVIRRDVEPPDPAEIATGARPSAPTTLPASPIAHGTALGLTLNALNGGGLIVLHEKASFDAAFTLGLVEKYQVRVLGIVGDAYARPLLAELNTGRWAGRLDSLAAISSSGAVWSPEVQRGLSEHLRGIRLIDNFGSTEALVLRSVDGTGFRPPPGLAVLGPDDRPVVPGSGQVGIVATSARIPVGYLNDPVKTAQSFRVVDGVRHLLIGDEALVNEDGTIRILGRGNSVINTGGEKVWPEEVEVVVRDHPAIADAAIVGMPDEKWGQRVTGVIVASGDVTDDDLTAHCRSRLTAYKCPKQWIRVADVPRTYVGKPDYAAVRELVEAQTSS